MLRLSEHVENTQDFANESFVVKKEDQTYNEEVQKSSKTERKERRKPDQHAVSAQNHLSDTVLDGQI